MNLLGRYGTSRCLTAVPCANVKGLDLALCAVPVGLNLSGLDLSGSACALAYCRFAYL